MIHLFFVVIVIITIVIKTTLYMIDYLYNACRNMVRGILLIYYTTTHYYI